MAQVFVSITNYDWPIFPRFTNDAQILVILTYHDRILALIRAQYHSALNLVPKAFPKHREKPWERGCPVLRSPEIYLLILSQNSVEMFLLSAPEEEK